MVDAITFVTYYVKILSDLRKQMNPIFHSVIDKMKEEDPHELISPDHQFKNTYEMYQFVAHRILSRAEN